MIGLPTRSNLVRMKEQMNCGRKKTGNKKEKEK